MTIAVTINLDVAERIDELAAYLGVSPEEAASFLLARYDIPK